MTSFNSIVYKARPVKYCRVVASARSIKLVPIRFSSTRVISFRNRPLSFRFSEISLTARRWRPRLVQYAVLAPTSFPSRIFAGNRFKLAFRGSDYSLSQAFGVNAKQDKDSLILAKSDFAQFGLNATWKVSDLILAILSQGNNNFKEDRRIRIKFYRYLQLISNDKAYAVNSYIIYLHTIATSENFPSPKDFLI